MHQYRGTVDVASVDEPNCAICNIAAAIDEPALSSAFPSITLKPTEEQAGQLLGMHNVTLVSKEAPAGHGRESITCSGYIGNQSTTSWSSGVRESTVEFTPYVTTFSFHSDTPSASEYIPQFAFWITPCRLITPLLSIAQSWTGDVKVERHHRFATALPATATPGRDIVFDQHFEYEKLEHGTRTTSHLAGVVEAADVTAADAESLLEQLDILLEVATLASRRKTVCYGWDYSSATSHIRCYLSNRTIPPVEATDGAFPLIDEQHFSEFYRSVAKNISDGTNLEMLRTAIRSFPSTKRIDLETGFLRLFYAIEVLVTLADVARSRFILKRSKWSNVRTMLQDILTSNASFFESQKSLDAMLKKLPELNRRSLDDSFRDFCEKFHVDLEHYWPLTDGSGGTSLQQIRNKLTHGHDFGDQLNEALVSAHDNLWAVAESCILGFLGWPTSKSKLVLRNHAASRDTWLRARTAFAEHLDRN